MIPYSGFLIHAIWTSIILPLCLVHILVHILPTPSSSIVSVCWRSAAYLLIIPVVYYLRTRLSIWDQTLQSSRLGAMPIPMVRGDRLLNLDIMQEWSQTSKGDYPGENMVKRLTDVWGQTINTRVLGEDSVITVSHVHAAQVLSGSFADFGKGPKFYERARALLGDGVFATDGETWKLHRSMTRPFFKSARVSDLSNFQPHTDRLIDILLGTLSPTSGTGTPIDIQDIFSRFTLDVGTSFLFGGSVDSLLDVSGGPVKGEGLAYDGGSEEVVSKEVKRGYAEGLKEAQEVLARRIKIGTLWSLFELCGDRMLSPMRKVRAFTRPIIFRGIAEQTSRSQASSSAKGVDEEKTLLDRLVLMLRKKDGKEDVKMIEDELINLLVAARDTTAATLTACVYCLAMYPEMARRIAQEVENGLGHEEPQSEEQLKELPYLQAFIHEVLRLYPPVPLNIRRSHRATLFQPISPSDPPLYMPANTSIILSLLLIQRSKDTWGPDADEFNPERWLESDSRSTEWGPKRYPGCFQAFSYGPRLCLGMQFALNQVAFVLVKLLQTFYLETERPRMRFVLAQDAQPPGTRLPTTWKDTRGRGKGEGAFLTASGIILDFKGGLWVRLVEDVGL